MHMRIRIARTNVGLSQAELASRLGIQRSAVANWESPTGALPATGHLIRLAEITNATMDWLATGRGAPPRRRAWNKHLQDDGVNIRQLLDAYDNALPMARLMVRKILGLAPLENTSNPIERKQESLRRHTHIRGTPRAVGED